MSNSKDTQKKPATTTPAAPVAPEPAAAAEVIDAEVVESTTTSTALATPTASAVTAPAAPAAPTDFEGRLAQIGETLADIAARNPDLQEAIEELILYTVAKVDGIEGSRGITIPNVNIRQKMTKQESLPGEVKEGELYTKQAVVGKELDFIPLFIHRKRVMFETGKERPVCYSNDGITGSVHGSCEKCAYGRYSGDTKADCSVGRAVSAVSSDFSQLYQIDFMKTSAKTGGRLETLAASPRGIYSSIFKLTTEKEKNAKGEFYKLQVYATNTKVRGAHYELARALSQLFKVKFDMSVENARNARARTAAGGAIDGNAGFVSSGEGADSDPDFASGAL